MNFFLSVLYTKEPSPLYEIVSVYGWLQELTLVDTNLNLNNHNLC